MANRAVDLMLRLAPQDGGLVDENGKSVRRKGSSVLRALALIEAVAERRAPATPTQLNEVLGLPKPTIHRLCATLEDSGFLQRSIDGRGLVAGPRLREIGRNALLSNDQLLLIRAVLEKVSREVGETANITVPDRNRMRYLDRVETQWPLRLQLPVGSQVPLHCTASGKLYLSSLDALVRRQLLKTLDLERVTENSITDPDALEQALARIDRAGFSTDNEEFIDGMVAVAVPVRNSDGRLVATLAIHAPVVRMSMEQAVGWADDLRAAAGELAKIVAANDAVAAPEA